MRTLCYRRRARAAGRRPHDRPRPDKGGMRPMTGMHIRVFGGHPSMNLTPRVAHLSACASRVRSTNLTSSRTVGRKPQISMRPCPALAAGRRAALWLSPLPGEVLASYFTPRGARTGAGRHGGVPARGRAGVARSRPTQEPSSMGVIAGTPVRGRSYGTRLPVGSLRCRRSRRLAGGLGGSG